MKKILVSFFLLATCVAHAQLNNSWIDYSKTYYKFKVGQDGLYRINQSTLANVGLNIYPAEQFQLWRNGQQIAIYTSQPSGILGSNDYIEFWGHNNDGIPDKPLYIDTSYQLSSHFSLLTDTATYFLTVNPGGNNLRYNPTPNNVAGSNLQPDAYFMNRVEKNFEEQLNYGFSENAGEPVYSAAYDQGEGWTSYGISTCNNCDLVQEFDNLNVYTAGPANSVSVYVSAFTNTINNSDVHVKLGTNFILPDSTVPVYSTIKETWANKPLSFLQSPDHAQIFVGLHALSVPDSEVENLVVATVALTYPATFNFNNQKDFYFELAASPAGNLLNITNFNNNGIAPVLYDINDGARFTGDISTPGVVKFALPGSIDNVRKFILVSQDASNITAINTLTPKTFINYTQAANQGDYIIITNPVLYNDGNGNNNVELYRQYRASSTGGGFNAITVSIDELNDQFAFGIKKHPAAIRDFIRLTQSWQVKPKYVFLIGRGMTSTEYRQNAADPTADRLDLVQTFGWPASDVLLACEPGTDVPLVPIARLPVVYGAEIAPYLQKVKDYEQAQASPGQTYADKGWMKNFLHVIGGADDNENQTFKGILDQCAAIAEDTLMGGNVSTFVKTSTAYIEQASGQQISQLINNGVNVISYFGHASASLLAFNLSTPQDYQNVGKYPFFNVSGCSAGNFYLFDPSRLLLPNGNLSISEQWTLASQSGAIAFMADTHLGIPPFLQMYDTALYKQFSLYMYGNTIGNQMQAVLRELGSNPQVLTDGGGYYLRIHLEEIGLNGDPAIKVNYFSLPDYDIEDQFIKISPSIISVANGNFTVSVKMLNIGRAINDSMRVIIKRILPNNTVQILYDQKIFAIQSSDSLTFTVPINAATDAGNNQIVVMLDADDQINELSKANNIYTKNFTIFRDELTPVYPYNYSIINQQNLTYYASTADALSGQRQYVMQVDTSALFNSAFMKQYTASGPGGIVQFTPGNLTFTDSVVYYWRTSLVPVTNTPIIWNTSSFVYLKSSSPGFNQSHYYQYLNNTYNNISLDSASRIFKFTQVPRNLTIQTGLYPYYVDGGIYESLDALPLEAYGCKYNSIQVMVYDTTTFIPWKNYNVDGVADPNSPGLYGSAHVCQNTSDTFRYFFEFPYTDFPHRDSLIKFLNNIPTGMYVSITNLGITTNPNFVPPNTTFISDWKGDTTHLGSGVSLYNTFKSLGFTQIDSFTHNLPFLFFFRKNRNDFSPQQFMGSSDTVGINEVFPVVTTNTSGTITSALFGPAKDWQSLHWLGKSIDKTASDSVQVQVYGVKQDGVTKTLLATVSPATDTSLAFINPLTYPYVQLVMLNSDSINVTPSQLKYWRINADYVPEGAVAPGILYTMQDTVTQGQKIPFALAFKNIGPIAYPDSLTIQISIINSNNKDSIISYKGKVLALGDTLVVRDSIDTKNLAGNNTLNVFVNPNYDQPEQYLFNNFIAQTFFVTADQYNPLLDVTFDGVHILNRDIVSSKPHIVIKLQDENKFLSLSDTSLIKVQVYFPDPTGLTNGTLITYHFGDSMQFIPANLATGQNTASINLTPTFPIDGQYELIVSGTDVEGNTTGSLEYRVAFTVINKEMISNLFNYPNPFTTSTAFVFTITGSELPQNMRIQILTITGKVVKEITQNELGPLHIGDNITEYKWDGTDMYGQKLANGVYLYRVLTNLNGKPIDNYNGTIADPNNPGQRITISSGLSNTNQYFTKGYGKMYLMR